MKKIVTMLMLAGAALFGAQDASAGTYCVGGFKNGDRIKAGTKLWADTYKILFVTVKPTWHVALWNDKNNPDIYVKGGKGGQTYTLKHDYRVAGWCSSKLLRLVQMDIIWKITHNPNGGNGWATSERYLSQLDARLSTFRPTKANKNFWGWAWDKNATRPDQYPGDYHWTNGDGTLYALWRYNCAFKAGTGGTVSTTGKNNVLERNKTSCTATPATGYKFSHWTGPTGTSYNKTITVAQNGTWTANFTPITYSVKYNANGGSGSMSNSTMTYGTKSTLRANSFTKLGYLFEGWATSAGGAVVYGNQAQVLNLSTTQGAVINLYAKWVEDPGPGGWITASTWNNVKGYLEQNRNVRLTQNISQTITSSSWITKTGGSVTLDLNGYKITQGEDGNTAVYIVWDSAGKVQLTIKDSVGGGAIVGCTSKKTTAGNGGGGFCLETSGSSLILEGGTLKNFRLESSSSTKLHGGCISLGSGTSFTMNGGTITGCTTSGNAGAIYNINGTVTINAGEISSCSGGNGGVLFNGGTANVYGGVFKNNSGAFGGCFYGYQKPIYIYGGKYSGNTSTYASEKSNFYAGWSWGNNGKLYGGIFAADPTTSDECHACLSLQGGATVTKVGSWYVVGKSVSYNKDNQLTAGNYTFNPKSSEYGSLADSNAYVSGSGTSWKLSGSAPILCSAWAQVKANLEAGNDVKLTQNISQGASHITTTGGQSVMLDLNGKTITQYATSSDGAYYLVHDVNGKVQLTIMDSSVAGTGAIVGNSSYTTKAGNGGGGFCLDTYASSSITLSRATLRGFRLTASEKHGGCVYVGSGRSFTMTDGAMIENCTSANRAGAIYSNGGTVKIENGSIIRNCTASAYAGGIGNIGGTLTITDSTISGCKGTGGGALGFTESSGTMTAKNSKFLNNQATSGYGAAINFGNNGGTFEIKDCSFVGNSATANGGALSIGAGGKVDIYNSVVTNNTAGSGYGGVHLNAGANNRARIYGGLIRDNKAAGVTRDFSIEKADAVTVYGGVFGVDPSGVANVTVDSEKAVEHIGSSYVVGSDMLAATIGLVAGSFTFDPMDAIYTNCGILDRTRSISTPAATTPTTWKLKTEGVIPVETAEQFQKAVAAGCSVELVNDITLTSSVVLAAPTESVIDLKGHVLTAAENARMFNMSASGAVLTIIDTVGGGACAGNGIAATSGAFAAVANGATLTLAATNAAVRGFTSSTGAGAISLANGAKLAFYAGAITNCTGTTAGAVSVGATSVCQLGGLAYIQDNCAPADVTNNVFLASGALVDISTNVPFQAGASIGITMTDRPAGNDCLPFTTKPDELATYVPNVEYFTSDIYGYTIQEGDENRVWMYVRSIELDVGDCENASNRVIRVNGVELDRTNGVYSVLIGTANITATFTADRGYAWIRGGKYVTEVTYGPVAALVDPTPLGADIESPTALVAAKIGEKEYPFLEDAIAAAKPGERIILCSDVTLDETIVIDKPIFIDLCGNTITGPNDGADAAFRVVDGGELKIADDHEGAEGKVKGAIEKEGAGVVKLSGGSYEPKPDSSFVAGAATMDEDGNIVPKTGDAPAFIAKDKDGNPVGTMTVSWELLAKNGVEVPEDLNQIGENGIPRWQALSLGLDPNDATAVPLASPVQQADPEKVVVNIENVAETATPVVTGTKVHYQLMASDDKETWQNVGAPAANPNGLKLEKKPGGAYYKFYKTKAVIVTGEE